MIHPEKCFEPCHRTLLVALALLIGSGSAMAGGTVASCDDASLRSALTGGGTVSFAHDCTIAMTNGVEITADTIIDADGYNIVLDGGGSNRFFKVVSGASLTLKNLILKNGRSQGAIGEDARGGAILVNGGTLHLVNTRFWTNSTAGGAGDAQSDFGNGGAAWGGAVFVQDGTLNATNCQFIGNAVVGGTGARSPSGGLAAGNGGNSAGGALFATNAMISLRDCLFFGNAAVGGPSPNGDLGNSQMSGRAEGGAVILVGGSLWVWNSSFTSNAVSSLKPEGQLSGTGGAVAGGALVNKGGVVEIGQSIIELNRADGGEGRRHLGNGGSAQGGAIYNSGSLELTDSFIVRNVAQGGNEGDPAGDGMGGALFNGGNAHIIRTLFRANSTGAGKGYTGGMIAGRNGITKGGAIFNTNTIALDATTFDSNVCQGPAGGISGFGASRPGSRAYGGALFNSAQCQLTNCTFASNSARGGIWNVYPMENPFDNSTAGGDAIGGAIFNESGSLVSVNSTIANNGALGGFGYPEGKGYGGGLVNSNGTAQLVNTLLSANIPSNSIPGMLSDLGFNLSTDSSCQFAHGNSINSGDSNLGPLDDYGGLVPTMALLIGSDALNAGNPSTSPSEDARGRTRPFGSAPDIGAFESSAPYVIRGTISGATFSSEVSVRAAGVEAPTTNRGTFALFGIAAGNHSVVPSSPDYVFLPDARAVNTGPDQIGVDFKAYRWNTLSPDWVSNQVMHVVLAATNGLSVRLHSSTNLHLWTPVQTNVAGPSQLIEMNLPIGSDPARFFRTSTP